MNLISGYTVVALSIEAKLKKKQLIPNSLHLNWKTVTFTFDKVDS